MGGSEGSREDIAELAALAVHDLQAPLRAVAGMVGLLAHRYRGELDAEADEIIDLALAECERMRVLIGDVLAVARVGGIDPVIEEVDLRDEVGVAVRALAAEVDEAGGTVRIADLPVVWGDRVLLVQVIQNLLANGLAFRRPGVAPVVEVAARRVDGAWRVTVTDNGIGVPVEHRDRVFRMFERLVPTDGGGGAGMGLAIAERAVRRHGGEIGVDPTPHGPGSTFWFTIPD